MFIYFIIYLESKVPKIPIIIWRHVVPSATHRAPVEGSDQTVRMHRLIWVFDGRISQLVPFAVFRLMYDFNY